jgi:hypothetical protein
VGSWQDEIKKLARGIRPETKQPEKVIKAPSEQGTSPDTERWKVDVTPLRQPRAKERADHPRPLPVTKSAGMEADKSKQKINQGSEPGIRIDLSHFKGGDRSTPSLAESKRKQDALIRQAIKTAYPGERVEPSQSAKRPKVDGAARLPIQGLDFGSFDQPSLTRANEFRKPAAWISEGRKLSVAASGRALRVRMGIDFGTAYTKVALGIMDKVLLVTWDGVRTSDEPFLLPGELSVANPGDVWLGRAPECSSVLSDLKLPYISEQPMSVEKSAAAVAFLAWVMRYARAWLYHYHGNLIQARTIAWEVNLGCPTNSWVTRSITDAYRRNGKAAWRLSQDVEAISIPSAHGVLIEPEVPDNRLGDIGLDGIHLVPEFVAQISGYLNSPMRRDGLHCLVDIGAGTFDVAAFNVYHHRPNGEDRFPIFASAVQPLGTHFLMRARFQTLNTADTRWDDLLAVPEGPDFEAALGLESGTLSDCDADFSRKVGSVVRNILSVTKARRYPAAPEWTHGLPVFLAGGGCLSDVHRQGLIGAFEQLRVPPIYTPYPVLQLEGNEAARVGNQFHRLSVAYGLTFDAESSRRILAPSEIEDVAPTIPRPEGPEWDAQWQK